MPPLGAVCRRPGAGLEGHHACQHGGREGGCALLCSHRGIFHFAPSPQSTMAALPAMAFAPGVPPALDLALDDLIKMNKKDKKKAQLVRRPCQRRSRC